MGWAHGGGGGGGRGGGGCVWEWNGCGWWGPVWVAPELVARYAAFQGGERILLRRLGPVRRRVALIPGIQRAVVRRVLPSRVVIEVVEGGPLVRLQGRAELGVDEAGVIFPPPGGLDLPLAGGLWGGGRIWGGGWTQGPGVGFGPSGGSRGSWGRRPSGWRWGGRRR